MGMIAVLIDNFFEDSEYLEPVNALREAGHTVIPVGLQAGKIVFGKQNSTKVEIEMAVKNADIPHFSALLIPGGYSPDKVRADRLAVTFVDAFFRSGKPVFAICHGPQLLISADVLRGRRVTGWSSIKRDLENAGAVFVDEKVVVDGNLVSSRSPDDLPAFIRTMLEMIGTPIYA